MKNNLNPDETVNTVKNSNVTNRLIRSTLGAKELCNMYYTEQNHAQLRNKHLF